MLCKESVEEGVTRGVLASVNPDGNQGTLIDLTTRVVKPVKLAQFEVEDVLPNCMESSRLPPLICLLKKSLQLSKQGTVRWRVSTQMVVLVFRIGSHYGKEDGLKWVFLVAETGGLLENTWILALSLKALCVTMQVHF